MKNDVTGGEEGESFSYVNASETPDRPPRSWKRDVSFALLLLVVAGVIATVFFRDRLAAEPLVKGEVSDQELVAALDREFRRSWESGEVAPTVRADDLAVARRISLALTGALPSLEEIRMLEAREEGDRLGWFTNQLLADRRSADYLSERFTRALVGTEGGPFIVYRRHRMKSWLADELAVNRPWDELVRELISAEGIWTSNPNVNFLTVAIDQNASEEIKRKKPDPVKLAARTARAFLGVRIDCMQCHDDKFGDRFNQADFHQLAAFFADAEMSIAGMREKDRDYSTRYKGEHEEQVVPALVPFGQEWLPAEGDGGLRERLAVWTTHAENEAFARAAVNRVWAILFNRALVEPLDDIPLEGPYPPALELLAADFAENGFDLQRLIRTIAATEVFALKSGDSLEVEAAWASFPMSRLRPEQLAGSITQASSLGTIDRDAPFIRRVMKWTQANEFVKRYGDLGEDEFGEQSGTIPQRLLMLNGKMVGERSGENPLLNSSTRIGQLAPNDQVAVESAYLTVLARYPTEKERDHFLEQLEGKKGSSRSREMEDIYWTLFNSTEFSWNH